jgi:myosin heavy subunit
LAQLDLAPDCGATTNLSCPYPGGLGGEVELGLKLTLADYQALLDDLAQAQALDQERLARIYHLEQALDQALICLDEARAQVRDQQVLETLLANTEEFAYVQQQAIAQLKLDLAEQRQALEAQILETQQRDQAVQELLETIEAMTQAQQRELERLRLRLAQDQLEVQTHRTRFGKQLQDLQAALESRQQRVSELEAETLAARALSASLQKQLESAQQQVKELSTSVRQYRANLTKLETQVEQRQTLSAAYQRHRTVSAEQDLTLQQNLQQNLAKAQHRIEELEARLTQQMVQQSQWQQNHQEIDQECDRLQSRVTTLEQQAAEMQEQILQQAQQATEYEAAVQYWKDCHASSQHQMAHLRTLLEQALCHPSLDGEDASSSLLSELMVMLQLATSAEGAETMPLAAVPLPRLSTVELPAFLVRRRSYNVNS